MNALNGLYILKILNKLKNINHYCSTSYIKFDHIKKSQKIPYVIYANFESINKISKEKLIEYLLYHCFFLQLFKKNSYLFFREEYLYYLFR